MKHPLKLLLVVLLCLFLFSSIQAQENAICPTPLVSTSDNHSILNWVFHTQENIIYQVRQSDPTVDMLYSVPIDNSVPPALLYQYDGYMHVLSFADDKLIVTLADTQLVAIDLNTGSTPSVSTIFETEQSARFIAINDSIGYITDESKLYALDATTYTPTLLSDQFAVGDDGTTRYRITDEYLVYFGHDGNGDVGIYSQSLENGDVTLLSEGLNVGHGLKGGVYYVFFVTDTDVIFEVMNDVSQAEVYIAPIEGGEPISLMSSVIDFGFGGEIALSKNEDYLVYKDGGDLFTVPTDGSAEPYLIATIDRLSDRFSLSQDGAFVVYTQDRKLYRASLSGQNIEVFDAEAPVETNFNVYELENMHYITTAAPNTDRMTGYMQPHDLSAPMKLLFQSAWDYQYGQYILPVDDEHIVFRTYNGDGTQLSYQHKGAVPVQLGCEIEGHVRLLDAINADIPVLIYSVNDRDLYVVELES